MRPSSGTRCRPRSRANGKMIIDAGQVTGKPTFDGWVVNTEFAKENKDFMVAFVKAIAAANAMLYQGPGGLDGRPRPGDGDCQDARAPRRTTCR